MGSVFDLEKRETNYRCTDVKEYVIIITYLGIFCSTLFLLYGIIKMICVDKIFTKRFSFITEIIIFIFFSELLNVVSKTLQFLKYAFEDTRTDLVTNSVETPRGIICQIQIVFAIISDFSSLLGTLLLSFRSHEVVKSKKRLFDKKKARVISFLLIISFSIIVSLILLFIDKYLTRDVIGIKFDLRDRCSYWCWLEHNTSMVCYGFYAIITILNIIFACKTNRILKEKYEKLKEQVVIYVENDNANTLNDNNNSGAISEGKKYISPEDKGRIKELKIMRVKSKIYPIITIMIWILAAIYRFSDDIMMRKVDSPDAPTDSQYEESDYFKDHEEIRIIEEINLVMHTLLSSFRGIAYGLCFIIFEEKKFRALFGKYCNKCCLCLCCLKDDEDLDDSEETENNSGLKSDSPSKGPLYNSIGKESNEEEQNLIKMNEDEIQRNNEMNNSNYNFND